MEGKMRYKALARKVLVVAVEGAVNDWACYIDSVEGISHEREFEQVARRGTKLDKRIAEMLFPAWKRLTYRR